MIKQEPNTKVIEVYNKKAKTTYIYEDTAYWDPVLKQGRHKRKGIGKLDANGKPVYNEYYRNRMKQTDEAQKERVVSKTTLLGENLILDKIIADTGLKQVLTKTIGKEKADLSLQLVKHSVCEGKPFCYAETWLDARGFEGSALSSQRITDFLRSLDKDVQNGFYAGWIAKKAEKRSLLFDISSISSYAKNNPYVEWGYNKDREKREQINIALISAYESNTPLWCTELPGSMSDQIALEYVFDQLEKLDVGKVGLFLDKGFYSEYNIRNLTQKSHKFTIPVPSHLKWQKEFIDNHRGELQRPANLIETGDETSIIYGLTVVNTTKYGRMWVHLYYDAVRKERDIASLMATLNTCQAELEDESPLKGHQYLYERYFEVRDTPKRGRKVTLKHEAVDEYISGHSGYWMLLSSDEKDTAKALSQCRNRNDIELHFDDMKNLLDCKRIRVHSDDVMQGRIFINFLAMIVVNELKRFLASIPAKERKYWNHQMILHKVATYAKIHYRGKYKDVFSKPTKSQRLIFDLFDIKYDWKGKLVHDEGEVVPADEDEET
ncbi:MAG: transposase [Sphaerochaeta sp.]|nr:transposase [Sphaerochaeta sp.]